MKNNEDDFKQFVKDMRKVFAKASVSMKELSDAFAKAARTIGAELSSDPIISMQCEGKTYEVYDFKISDGFSYYVISDSEKESIQFKNLPSPVKERVLKEKI